RRCMLLLLRTCFLGGRSAELRELRHAALGSCRASPRSRRRSKSRCLSCRGRSRRNASCRRLSQYYRAALHQTLCPRDYRLEHLSATQRIIRAKIANVECINSHAGVVGVTLEINQPQPRRRQAFFNHCQVIAELIVVSLLFSDIDPLKKTRKEPRK